MPRRFVPGPFPRLHLVTPAVVEWTIGRLGVGGILNDRERRVVDGFAGAGIAAVARTATDGSVGVDIEGATSLDPAVIRRVMGSSGIAAFGPEGSLDPLAIWTAKEAAYKASSAVCSALRDVELTWSDGRPTSARIADARAPRHSLGVRHRTVGGYTVAVAVYRAAA